MPKIGDTLYVKNIEEPVTFIAERKLTSKDTDTDVFPINGGSGVVYIVRRAIMNPETGVVIGHKFFDFLAEELCTHKEKLTGNVERMRTAQTVAMEAGYDPETGTPIMGRSSTKPS